LLLDIGPIFFQQFLEEKKKKKGWVYSKFIIKGIVTFDEWGPNLHTFKFLVNFQFSQKTYNYFDYFNVLEESPTYDNNVGKHSWFIQFQLSQKSQVFSRMVSKLVSWC
jgi:hypothetical protein